ncbi:MAG: ferrous iron transport protein B [Actinobacteria bacterium]|nr:ferrous iron transport protein B [Actinomycetota bacterium]
MEILKVFKKFIRKKSGAKSSCHGGSIGGDTSFFDKIAIVGSPNVGKSVIFNILTGSYATVSNYPGTTVEVFRGKGKFGTKEYQIIDTPGMYSLLPITEEEKVARTIILEEKPKIVIQVIDAKNLESMLPFTMQLIDAGLPLIVNLNIMDEAENLGLSIDIEKLQNNLGVPVVETTAVSGKNIAKLREIIESYRKKESDNSANYYSYNDVVDKALKEITGLLEYEYRLSKHSIAMLLLLEDEEVSKVVSSKEKNYSIIKAIISETKNKHSQPMNYVISLERQKIATDISNQVITKNKEVKLTLRDRLSRATMNPWMGFPIFFIIIFALYEFVGVFGAQTAVNFLEGTLFGNYINPAVNNWVSSVIPWKILQDLIANDYGIITLGVRYSIALILPIVTTFFLAFSIIEDTGYLPRLAMLVDRAFKKIGLNGRAVIPIILGFGCDTMAVVVTRTLETKREKIISSFLLALAIPCSAQLGVMLALLSGNFKAFGIWILVMISVFLLVGYLAAKILPGEKPLFYMVVPPLRWPRISNVLIKTFSRVKWYFKEIFPLFIAASVVIWIGKITRIFDFLIKILEFPVRWIGLPPEAAKAFLFGFFRRDFGAAGLYDLKASGVLIGIPLVVAVVTMTLFIPCIAQFSITAKERGIKTAIAMGAIIIPFAFIVGAVLNIILKVLGVSI